MKQAACECDNDHKQPVGMSRVLLTSHRAVALTEIRTAHKWCDQPRARNRHAWSDLHFAHITFVRADKAALDVVDIDDVE